jgi:cell division protein ZapB
LATFPEARGFQWHVHQDCRRAPAFHRPLRGQRSSGAFRWTAPSCFPFNCTGVNTGTGTNGVECKRPDSDAYNPPAMSKTDELAERVERLLLRHDELKRTNVLLAQQLQAMTAERDSLKQRLTAARSRIDALLERLPADGEGRPR